MKQVSDTAVILIFNLDKAGKNVAFIGYIGTTTDKTILSTLILSGKHS
jgi:hypothetical protein